jgi:Zn-dependent protease with chaperone function
MKKIRPLVFLGIVLPLLLLISPVTAQSGETDEGRDPVLAYRLATTGQARWYNPAWLFVNGYYRIFLRITLGASRLQEILADRYAAIAYGAQNFIDALTHIVHRTVAFNAQVNHEVKAALAEKRSLQNVYALIAPDSDNEQAQINSQVQQIINRPTSAYDSHPATADRIKYVQAIPMTSEEKNSNPVWDLFPNAEALQDEMTTIIRGNVTLLR